MGTILTKLDVVAEGSEHGIMISSCLKRLRAAITITDHNPCGCSVLLSLWACLVAQVGNVAMTDRVWFKERVISHLSSQYGDGMDDLDEDVVRGQMQRFLWHSRINEQFSRICSEFRCDLRCTPSSSSSHE